MAATIGRMKGALAGLALAGLAASAGAQPSVGSTRGSNTRVSVTELPGGFRLQQMQDLNQTGFGAPAPLPPANPKILRTPRSQRLSDRLSTKRQKILDRSQQGRSKVRGKGFSTRGGAAYRALAARRAKQEGRLITPDGVIEPDRAGGLHTPSGLASGASTVPPPPKPPTARDAYIAEVIAKREERRRIMQDVMARIAHKKATREKAQNAPKRRYGARGGLFYLPPLESK